MGCIQDKEPSQQKKYTRQKNYIGSILQDHDDSKSNQMKRSSSAETAMTHSCNIDYGVTVEFLSRVDLTKCEHPRIRQIRDQAQALGGIDTDIAIIQ